MDNDQLDRAGTNNVLRGDRSGTLDDRATYKTYLAERPESDTVCGMQRRERVQFRNDGHPNRRTKTYLAERAGSTNQPTDQPTNRPSDQATYLAERAGSTNQPTN